MKPICEEDLQFLEKKYHDPAAPFDPFNRMMYHGYAYDPATGLDDEEMDRNLAELSESLEGLPRPIHKARLFAYVLDHTRIDVNEHDYFVGFWSWGRPISKYTVNKWNREVSEMFPEASGRLAMSAKAGGSFGWLDFDHTVPNWDSLTELGFPGILKRAEKYYLDRKARGELTEKQEALYRGIETEYEAILRLLDRMYRYALTKKGEKSALVAESLRHLRDGAPQNCLDAMQLIYLYFMLSESVEHYQVRSLGYGLDSTLYPFYVRDLENGTFTKAQISEFLAYFLMQWSAIGNYWGQPFYLGGTDQCGRTKVTDLSGMILQVYDSLGIYNPKIQIKINDNTPEDFVRQALDMIRHGVSSIVFVSERHILRCLMNLGYTYQQATDSVISGCYEYKTKAGDIGIGAHYPNPLKPVSYVFDDGFDTVTGVQLGPHTGAVTGFTSFEAFYAAYLEQLRYMLEKDTDAMETLMTKIDTINPSLMFSATMEPCMEKMRDALDCGIENDSGLTMGGIGSAVDALMAVYELVFEKRETSLAELKDALDADWVGYEKLRMKALNCKHKYGNADPLADSYAAALIHFVGADLLAGRRNPHGGKVELEAHSARAFIINGEKTKATPDGRKAGEETSKNASPAPGADRKGITALIESATAIDTSLCTKGFCLDAVMHPTAVQGEDGLEAMAAVLKTYIARGGASIHFNIFNTEMLRDAQAHPEKYKNLQIRVCGWNVLWNNLPRSEQDAYIRRAEAQQ